MKQTATRRSACRNPAYRLAPVFVLLQLFVAARADQQGSSTTVGTDIQGSGPVEVSIVVERLVTGPGGAGTVFLPMVAESRLSNGDEVQYSIRVSNPGAEPVADLVVTKRLPTGLRYKPGTAVGPGCETHVSGDGGDSFAKPAALNQAATGVNSYSHVRWILSGPLAPGATLILRFRAIFN